MIDFGVFIFYILIPMTEFISTLYAGLDHTMEMLFLTNCTYMCCSVGQPDRPIMRGHSTRAAAQRAGVRQ